MNELLQLAQRQERELLIAFADIHGYFRHSQRASDSQLAEDLDDYYALVARLVRDAGGVVIKFIGDAALIAFSDTRVDNGVECLLALKTEADSWLDEHGWKGCVLNVKAHFGPAIVGPYGPPEQRRLDALGRAVNTAARLPSPGVALSPQAFRKLSTAARTRFKKHTPPITYIRIEDPHRD